MIKPKKVAHEGDVEVEAAQHGEEEDQQPDPDGKAIDAKPRLERALADLQLLGQGRSVGRFVKEGDRLAGQDHQERMYHAASARIGQAIWSLRPNVSG